MPRRAPVVLTLALLFGSRVSGQDASPQPTAVQERAEVRLAQIDVTVYGPPDVVRDLGPDDFELRIQLTRIREIRVDRLCGSAAAAGGPVEPDVLPSYLLYFDQPYLTFAGRQNAIEIARRLVSDLASRGARLMIVSNARAVEVVAPLSSDQAALLAALDRLENDRTQWDGYAELEDLRVAEVTRELNEMNNFERAVTVARQYQREERVRAERDLRRLAVSLGQLAEAPPPKAVVYFADTMRANAGEHYLAFFGRQQRAAEPRLGPMAADSATAPLAVDEVQNKAAAQGIRIHTVEARGLQLSADLDVQAPVGMVTAGAVTSSSRVRLSDAHRTLEGLAAESGGQSFLHGIGPGRIVERLASDAACVYLLSFDPAGFREDQPLAVRVEVRRPGVTQRTRGRLVVESDSTRLASRILRAFAAPESIPDPFQVRTGLIPTGFQDGRYSALVQVAVPGSSIVGATWDLGATLVEGEKIRGRASGRIAASAAGAAAILESEIVVPAGVYDLVAVAHEDRTGLVSSTSVRIDWPALRPSRPGVGPIAVVQPALGAFVREGATRRTGSVVTALEDPIDPAKPTAFVALVCPGGAADEVRLVERSLAGTTRHEFPLQDLTGESSCVQMRDVVPSNALEAGAYRYVLRVTSDERVLAHAERELVVVPGRDR